MPIRNIKNLDGISHSRLPGDPLQKNVPLLLFEEALYSFYVSIFPLLRQKNLRALLGVAPRYIVESTRLDPKSRLSVPYGLSMQDGFFETQVPFCTWEELREMVLSGHVEVASFSFSKMNLTFPFVDVEREVVRSKQVLEERLPQHVSSFIFPFGKKDGRVEKLALEHYTYLF